MTKAQLRLQIALVVSYFMLLLIISLVDKMYFGSTVYNFIKDFSSMFIACAAAYLTYCFTRRQAHIASLRELWKQAISSKSELIQYTHLNASSREQFGKAHSSISTTIDLVRSVYRNVGETEDSIGLFPFEPLHDMRKCLERIGFTDLQPEKCANERRNIIAAWNAFRSEFLKEFQTPEPPHPITQPASEDTRRNQLTTVPEAESR